MKAQGPLDFDTVSVEHSHMPTPTLADLPSPATSPPEIPPGIVRLYRDDNWASATLDLSTKSYRPGSRQSIAGTPMQDAATWVAFNLPVGTVMTLLTNDVPQASGKLVNDLSGAGPCVDLVGTGRTETVDLTRLSMNDAVSAFFWRTFDPRLGAVELFEHSNFGGNRAVLFLSEWPPGVVTSIADWWINDRVSSARWTTLDDRQSVSLYENADGGGRSYQNIQGWGDTRENANLSDANFNDSLSSFRWDGLIPMKEEVAPFTLDATLDMAGATSITSESSGTNNTSLPQTTTVQLSRSDAQTVTLTSTDTHVVGTTISLETSFSVSYAGATAGVKLTVGLNFSYTHTQSTTTSTTTTIALNYSEPVTAPPNTNWTATLVVQIGKLPPTPYKTTAVRWYDQPVAGGVQDPTNNNWYKRTEQVTGLIAGGLGSRLQSNVTATPISH